MLISEYFGAGEHKDRSANIYQDDEGYFVEVYFQGWPVKQIDVRDHSIRYAEDTADNWVCGLIKE
jgi:hypothetical protein